MYVVMRGNEWKKEKLVMYKNNKIFIYILIPLLFIAMSCSDGKMNEQESLSKSDNVETSSSFNNDKKELCPLNFDSDLVIEEAAIIAVENKELAKSFMIPNTVSSIKKESFSYCNNLEWLYIPSSVMVIEKEAFYKCSSLSFLIFDSPNVDIKDNALLDCFSLSYIYCIGKQSEYSSLVDGGRSDISTDIISFYSSIDELPFILININ